MKAAIVVGGLILPFLVWMVYLDVTYWGICIDKPAGTCAPIDVACGVPASWFRGDGAFSLGSEYPFRRLVVDAA